MLAPLRGPEWAYRRRARLGVKYVHKKGRVLAGFREREKPYIADVRRCEILLARSLSRLLPQELAALAETLDIREKLPQVEVAAGDDATALVFRVLEAPGAADLEKIAAFGARRGCADLPATAAASTACGRCADALSAALTYAVDAGTRARSNLGRSISSRSTARSMHRWSARPWSCCSPVRRTRCSTCSAAWGISRCRWRGARGGSWAWRAMRRWSPKRAPMPRATAFGNAEFAVENLFEPTSSGAWANERYDLVLLDPPRAGAAELMAADGAIGGRVESCIFPAIRGVWRGMRGSWSHTLGFTLTCAGVMDMFPHTTHVESIAVFEASRMSLGPLMVDVAGTELTAEDVACCRIPLVGSVILFTRNYRESRTGRSTDGGHPRSTYAASA